MCSYNNTGARFVSRVYSQVIQYKYIHNIHTILIDFLNNYTYLYIYIYIDSKESSPICESEQNHKINWPACCCRSQTSVVFRKAV